MRNLPITATDDGRQIELAVGETRELVLQENPTTGYLWTVASTDEAIAQVLDAGYTSGAAGGLGAGGVHRFMLTGVSRGAAVVECWLARPWEDARAGLQAIVLRLSVT